MRIFSLTKFLKISKKYCSKFEQQKIKYKLIEAEHYEQVIEHLRKNFFPEEPLNRAAGLCQDGVGNTEVENHSLDTLQYQCSVMAIDMCCNSSCQIAGVILNAELRPGETEQALEDLQKSTDFKYKLSFEVIYKHSLQVDLFARYGVDRIFDVRALSVDARYRGQGIGKELVRRAEQVARNSGYQLLRTDATGIFSQKVFSSQGFRPISELLYANYKNDAGQDLTVEAPHEKLQVLIKQLDDECNETAQTELLAQ